jgi:hypothetical protein
MYCHKEYITTIRYILCFLYVVPVLRCMDKVSFLDTSSKPNGIRSGLWQVDRKYRLHALLLRQQVSILKTMNSPLLGRLSAQHGLCYHVQCVGYLERHSNLKGPQGK